MLGLNKLRNMINLWGGKLICTNIIPEEFVSPFSRTVGLDWNNKYILYTKDCDEIWKIIHEAGHVFAANKDPFLLGDKEKDFLAWEWCVLKQIGIPFKRFWNHVDDYHYDFYISLALKNKLITKDLKPLAIRK